MLRNREIKYLFTVMLLISFVALFISAFFTLHAFILILITSVLLMICILIFTKWRYRELEKLSNYLRQISAGDYFLDVRDNDEGELSILKNEIYKVTTKLTEQSSILQKDKIQLKDAISDISHQLKTPLTSMMVMADLLNDNKLPPAKKKEFLRHIHVQLERIEWLVSSLLKISRIDAGTVHFNRDTFTVKILIQKALRPLLIPIDIKELIVSTEGEDTVSIIGDLHWTTEALINILKNCVEHTQNGGVIKITYAENALYSEIIITDNGKGIAKEDIPYIFNRFYKGKNASEGSIGIGLAMAYSIITSQNGDITVRNVDHGTQFRIIFYKQVI